jgi:sulfatase modifying factor 1
MALVEGDYCPWVGQKCLEHHQEYVLEQRRLEKAAAEGKPAGTSTVSERCLRYEEPSRCLSKKRPMRFCVDRYEWPNKKGELPSHLVSWHDAKRMCSEVGKRLCSTHEFNFACEGEQMWPYTYGYVRDDSKCNIDKPYRLRRTSLKRYKACMADPKCKEAVGKLDQREPAGSRPECVSPFGVYDLNGNINEWVVRPGKEAPDRSGLKSGWWGPVRCRCRPTVGFHKEADYGYEVGFRCCKDADVDGSVPP